MDIDTDMVRDLFADEYADQHHAGTYREALNDAYSLFDRWLAREWAEAFDEGVGSIEGGYMMRPNPYREEN